MQLCGSYKTTTATRYTPNHFDFAVTVYTTDTSNNTATVYNTDTTDSAKTTATVYTTDTNATRYTFPGVSIAKTSDILTLRLQ